MTRTSTSPAKPVIALLLVGLVLFSSILGLTAKDLVGGGGSLDARVDRAADFFVHVWSESVLADAVFVLTSAGAAILAVAAGRRWHLLVAPLVAFALAWLGYAMSFLLLEEGSGAGFSSFEFVLEWGWPGLALATIAPAIYVYVTPPR